MTTLAAGPAQAESDRLLEKGAVELGLALGRGERSMLLQYLALLEKWNQAYNLTAIRDVGRMVTGHLLDCLSIVPYLTGTRMLDAGSGAGFPGIPVAVARPDIQVVLLDSNQKKTAFLRQAVADLRLKNATVVCERVEAWRTGEKFDFIISRAFAEIAEFIALTEHLLAPGGVFAAMKGVYPFEEIERLPPGLRVRQSHALAVPGLEAERHLVLIERP
jgi:16S rRNA (guanine527-N7)-methyltransferase